MNATDDHASDYTPTPAPAPSEPAAAAPPAAQAGAPAAPGPAQPYYPPAPGAPPAAQPQARDPRTKSPVLAGFLSCMPGLGQVYVGYYVRGFVHVIIVATLITMLATGDLDGLIPLTAIFMAFFWLYNIIDAVRRASLFNQYLAGDQDITLPDDFKMPKFGGSIFGGLILIGIGFILLLNTRWNVSLAWLDEWWPIAPILLGVYLLGKAVQERLAQGSDA